MHRLGCLSLDERACLIPRYLRVGIMDVDLIKLVNKLQDTFSHLGARQNSVTDYIFTQLVIRPVPRQ